MNFNFNLLILTLLLLFLYFYQTEKFEILQYDTNKSSRLDSYPYNFKSSPRVNNKEYNHPFGFMYPLHSLI